MRSLIVLSIIYTASAAYNGPQHNPVVIGPNGVPIEPADVREARGRHLAALAVSKNLPALGHYSHPALFNYLPTDSSDVAAAKAQHYKDYTEAAHRNGAHAPDLYHHALVMQNVYNEETPEVQAAKAAHFAAHAQALSRAHGIHYRKKRAIYGGYHIPQIGPNGVPVETPEVQAARASHLAALSAAHSNASPAYSSGYYPQAQAYSAPRRYDDDLRYYGPPAQIGSDGQPIETPEVKAAKAYHFAAHAALRSGYYGHF